MYRRFSTVSGTTLSSTIVFLNHTQKKTKQTNKQTNEKHTHTMRTLCKKKTMIRICKKKKQWYDFTKKKQKTKNNENTL